MEIIEGILVVLVSMYMYLVILHGVVLSKNKKSPHLHL